MKRDFHKSALLTALILSAPLSGWGQATNATNAQPTAPQKEPKSFQFGGGGFNQFMTKVRDVFGKDVFELIEIRGERDRIRVPKMRIQSATDIRNVLYTYNQLSKEGDGFLGKWIFSPALHVPPNNEVATIIFLAPKLGGPDGAGGTKVRAFSVRSLPEDRITALRDLIEEQSRRLQQEIAERSGDVSMAEGRVSVHQGTGLLIATGGATYVELVATLMDALQRQKGNMF